MINDKYDYMNEFDGVFDSNGISEIIDALDSYGGDEAAELAKSIHYKFFGGMAYYSEGDAIIDDDINLINRAEELLNK